MHREECSSGSLCSNPANPSHLNDLHNTSITALKLYACVRYTWALDCSGGHRRFCRQDSRSLTRGFAFLECHRS